MALVYVYMTCLSTGLAIGTLTFGQILSTNVGSPGPIDLRHISETSHNIPVPDNSQDTDKRGPLRANCFKMVTIEIQKMLEQSTIKKAQKGTTATAGKPKVYVRLVNGHTCHEGRVEIFAFNNWGTVCNDFWGPNDAAVICHMLGFSRVGARDKRAGNGVGSGMILLDRVHCTGSESSIADCPANNWGVNDCSHFQDAGVICNNSSMPDGFLLFTDTLKHLIFRMDLASGNYVVVPLRRYGTPIAIDYDSVDSRIYWTDEANRSIFSISIDARSQKVVKFLGNDSMANGIAVDHISRLLFYTDTIKETITLLTLDGLHEKVVINSGLDQPRAIELDPVDGMIYWTNWGIQPNIEKSNYDGTNRQTIISSGLGFPNGLALDLQRGMIYWTDETNFKIEGAHVNGTGRHTVHDDPQSQVYGIAYFEDYLYFTDWHKTTLMKVPVSGGAPMPVGPPGFGRLNDIHVHKSSAGSPGTNGCAGGHGGCNGICIPTANGGKKCI